MRLSSEPQNLNSGRFCRTRKIAKAIAANILALALLLVMFEGFAGYAFLLRNFSIDRAAPAKQQYTTYDAELGWVNKPNLYMADVYGPGIYVRTNARGFRQNEEVTNSVSRGKVRIICSGDSFTYGYGVDNAHTWCALLSVLDGRLEPVNMGTDGYGVDQAYLRFKRAAAEMSFQIHVFAFITDDFYRALNDSFLGYSKPLLKLQDGRLLVTNVPVPKRAYDLGWKQPLLTNLENLRSTWVLTKAMHKLGIERQQSRVYVSQAQRDANARLLLHRIFSDLKQMNEERSSRLVFTYLPTIWELHGSSAPGQQWSAPKQWAAFLNEEAASLRVPVINLFSRFESLPRNELTEMFIPPEKIHYPEGAFHLTEKGNGLIAREIYDQLTRDHVI
jgi:hypothetical protein